MAIVLLFVVCDSRSWIRKGDARRDEAKALMTYTSALSQGFLSQLMHLCPLLDYITYLDRQGNAKWVLITADLHVHPSKGEKMHWVAIIKLSVLAFCCTKSGRKRLEMIWIVKTSKPDSKKYLEIC